MKTMKKALAIVLTLSLVFTMAVPSFANSGGKFNLTKDPTHIYQKFGNKKTIKYLALGDSQTNGYYLDGYFIETGSVKDNNISFHDSHGFNRYVKDSYPDLFSEHLKKLGYRVELRQYALSAMRCEDLHTLLHTDLEPYADYFWSDNHYDRNGGKDLYLDTMYRDYYIDQDGQAVDHMKLENNLHGYGKAQEDFSTAIKEADVISLALGTNTFGNFMPHRIQAWINSLEEYDNPYDIGMYLDETQKKVFDNFVETVRNLAGKLGVEGKYQNLINYIIHDMAYSLVSFMTGYAWCLEDIEKLNKDVTLITMGMTNVCQDLVLNINISDKITIPFSLDLFYGTTMKAMNTYMKLANAKSKLDIVYVEPGEFEMQVEDMKKLNPDKVNFNNELEDLMMLNARTIIGDFFKFLEETDQDGKKYNPYTNSSDIMKGVKLVLDSACDGSEKACDYTPDENEKSKLEKIGQVYLGVRDVLIDVADEPEVDIIEAFKFLNDKSAMKEALEARDNAPAKEAFEKLTGSDIRAKVKETFSQNGLRDFLYVYNRILENAAGSHATLKGHETFADNIIAAYDKHEKVKKIKKAVPVIVGGVTVALIASSVVKNMNGGSYSMLSPDSAFGDAAVPAGMTGDVAQGSTFSAKIAAVVNNVKEFFSGIAEKIKQGKTYEFQYE